MCHEKFNYMRYDGLVAYGESQIKEMFRIFHTFVFITEYFLFTSICSTLNISFINQTAFLNVNYIFVVTDYLQGLHQGELPRVIELSNWLFMNNKDNM